MRHRSVPSSGSGSRVYLKMSESSAETGTMEYAIRNPLVFITGVADTDNDWLWSGRSDQLWSADDNVADKSVNDPCPYGWRVAPSGAFDNLAIVGTPAVGDEAKYGWTLTDGNAESFFIGAGRRRHGAQRLFILRLHLRHHFVPCASEGFPQRRVILQGLGVDHHHVDKLARYL